MYVFLNCMCACKLLAILLWTLHNSFPCPLKLSLLKCTWERMALLFHLLLLVVNKKKDSCNVICLHVSWYPKLRKPGLERESLEKLPLGSSREVMMEVSALTLQQLCIECQLCAFQQDKPLLSWASVLLWESIYPATWLKWVPFTEGTWQPCEKVVVGEGNKPLCCAC